MSSIFHIPEPCHENWSQMKRAGNGKRHCEVCNRHVHDFTRSAIADIRLKLTEENVCGRYHERHTTAGNRFYDTLNAIEIRLSALRLKRLSILFVAVAFILSGCARRHTRGRTMGAKFIGEEKQKKTPVEQVLQK